jgi:hypothetical protein
MPKPRKQPSTIRIIQFIAEFNGYKVTTRKKDKKQDPEEKKFLPDLVAEPFRGSGKRVFEVEATVTNNTIYKSLFSLLTALKNGADEAFLVVPSRKLHFAEGCLRNVHDVIGHFSKTARGANPKIRLHVVSFQDAADSHAKAEKYVGGGKIGQPPKSSFFPRVR